MAETPRRNRVLKAGLIAPLCVLPLAAILATSAHSADYHRIFATLMLGLLAPAYVLTWLIGVPLFLLLRRFGFASILTAAATGFATTWVVPILIAFHAAGHERHPFVGYWPYALGILKIAAILTVPFGVVGILVGIVFWLIAKPAEA